jgi:hypothetical protein
METLMKAHWQTWSLVSAAIVLLIVFGRLDLLAIVVPFSAVVGYCAWLSKRVNASRGR